MKRTNDETGKNEFLYTVQDNEQIIVDKIEKHIKDFSVKFDKVCTLLEEKINENDISDSNDFFQHFKNLLVIVEQKEKLDKQLTLSNSNKSKKI